MMEEYLMRHDQVSGDSAYSDSSDDSIENPPSFRTVNYKGRQVNFFLEMAHRRSDSSDDSGGSDDSVDLPPSFSGNLNIELERSIEALQSEFNSNRQTLKYNIKELDDAIEELESMHKNTTVGSLVGSSVGAAGGVAAIAGLCLAPFTFGASLALTGVGAVAGVAGGVTSAGSNITNMVRQKTLRENIEKIINDLLTTINPMEKLLDKIHNVTVNIASAKKTDKLDIQRAARGAVDVLNIARVANVADLGIMCAEAAKEIRVFVKAVKAARGSASAAKAARATAAAIGVLSAPFLPLNVYSIVQDSKELSEMNQPAGKSKEKNISSETLKFVLQMKAIADQFKKIVKEVQVTIDTAVKQHSSQARQRPTNVNKDGHDAYYFNIM